MRLGVKETNECADGIDAALLRSTIVSALVFYHPARDACVPVPDGLDFRPREGAPVKIANRE